MTDGIDNISVRIYRLDEDIKRPVIRGTGTLFEDKGNYYVLTAYHCLEKRKNGVVIIPLDLEQTKIAFFFQSDPDQQVDVDVIKLVDKDVDKDWALIAVRKPNVDWVYNGKLQFSNQIILNRLYECYPYLADYEGYGRTMALSATNKMGFWHIKEELTGGRYQADLLMEGGSGAGVMYSEDGTTFCCYGILKRTLEGGSYNDVCTVNMKDIMSVLSPELVRIYTKAELDAINKEGINQGVGQYTEKILAAQSNEELEEIATTLITSTIPTLIDNLQTSFASELFNIVNKYCATVLKENKKLDAAYHYQYGEYCILMTDAIGARESMTKAYELDPNNPLCIAVEAQRIWKRGDRQEGYRLIQAVADDNVTKLAMAILLADNPQATFDNLSEEQKKSYQLRYKILDLDQFRSDFTDWLYDVEIREPETLTLSNLSEWLFMFTVYRVRFRDYVLFSRESRKDQIPAYREAFNSTCKYYEKAKGTPLEKTIPLLEALQCYWGYICDIQNAGHWLTAYQSIDLSTEEEHQKEFCTLMLSSMLCMENRFEEAYQVIVEKHTGVTHHLMMFAIGLFNYNKRLDYLPRFIHEIHAEEFEMSTGESDMLMATAYNFHPDVFLPILKELKFEIEAEKRLLSDTCLMEHDIKVNTDDYPSFIHLFNGGLAATAAQLLFDSGKQEYALDYLKGKFAAGSFDYCEQIYLKMLGAMPSKRYEYLESIKRMRKNGIIENENQLRVEYNYSLTLGDYDNAYEVVDLLWKRTKEDEWVISAYIDLTGRIKPKNLPLWYEEAMKFPFKQDHFVKLVYYSFAKNGYVGEATHFLYTKVKEMKTSALSAFYDQEVIMGYASKVANKPMEKVTEGTYVVYTTNGSDRHCREMTSETVLGQALIGHHKDDEVKVDLGGQERTIKIIGIHNQYYYLHYTNMQEIMESGGNKYFTPFHFDVEPSEEGAKQIRGFLERFGDGGKRQKALEQYQRGELGLINLFKEDDAIGSYYGFLFSKFPIQLRSYESYKKDKPELMGNGHIYVLDLTSLLLLFEFSLLNEGWKPRKRFCIPKLIRSMIDDYKKELPVQSSFELQEAMTEGYIHRFADTDYLKKLEKRFTALQAWVDGNCELVVNTDILQIEQPIQNATQQLFTYTMVELLQKGKPLRVLLTEDWYLEKMMGTPLPIISTETYMYEVEGEEIGKAFTDFLHKNNCVFI